LYLLPAVGRVWWPAPAISEIYFCSAWRGAAVYFSVSWYPLPPDLLESWDWGLTTTKIFELEGLICKIFQTNELAVSIIIFRLTLQLQD
jgi:hypothetical protein